MNKLYKYKKIMFYLVFVIMVVFMWSFGSFYVSHSSASYKSDISGDSTAKVAKWNIVDVSKKEGASIDLELGFAEKITDTDSGRQGHWFLELDNLSEVNAKIDLNSKISLQLRHDTFTGLKNNDWNFLGSINPLKFNISLYQGSIDDVIKFKYGTSIYDYAYYENAATVTKNMLTPVFEESKLICSIIKTEDIPTFTSSSMIDGKIVYSIDVCLKDILTDQTVIDKLTFGFGNNSTKKVLCLSWEIDDSSIITVESFSELSSKPKNENYTYVVTNEGNQKYKWDSSLFAFVPINVSSDSYKRYELSTVKSSNIVSGTDPDGYSVTIGTEKEIYYFNEIECEFADYFLFSHGEPTYTFGSTMVRFSLLTSSQIAQVKARTITDNGVSNSPTSADYNDLKLYLEKLEYPQYDRFQSEYVSFASGSIYLSYGLSCKFILDLKVSQVD